MTNRNLVCGVGINDSDYITQIKTVIGSINCPYYEKWHGMLDRCYSEKYQLKHPTYKGRTVCEEWKYFMSFKSWMELQDWRNKELDKDIIKLDNKIYSPDTCCFVSKNINSLLANSNATRGKYPQGIDYHKPSDKFRAQISIDGKRKHLGYYNTVELAELAYVSVKREYIISKAKNLPDRIKQGLMRHADLLEDRAQVLMKTAFIVEEK